MDYPAFKARFGGSPEEIRARQSSYLDALEGRVPGGRPRLRPRGAARRCCASTGVPAYGVETEPDFVARLAENGLEVVEADALAHLAGARAGGG